ncbi:WxL domain-containing protein [Enterococcus sp. LJL120]
MKITSFLKKVTLILIGTSCYFGSDIAYANEWSGQGSVTVTDSGVTNPVDPENPEKEVDPGPGPSTDGELRIDFVSKLNFGSVSTTGTNRSYSSLAQLFHNEGTSARGYYIQVTDRRRAADGWNLTLTQDSQFNSKIIQDLDKKELEGAVLSFDEGWANSADNLERLPTVSRETLSINEMRTAYTVATASAGQGTGVWTIAFGASGENGSKQKNTLTALTDATGNAVMDSTFNKQAYSNSAISLSVPDTTKIYPVQYTTTLTWTLTAGPIE